MLNKTLMMLLLLLAGSVVLAGAWPNSSAPSAAPIESAFLPQTVELDADVVGSAVSAAQLLDKALDRLKPERTVWLKTKIRQTMTDAKTAFVAEGFLQRGPHNCARLELDVLSRGNPAKLVIVSDGGLIAEVKKIPKLPAVEKVTHLLPEDASADAATDVGLNSKGCGGPAVLLEQFRQRLKEGKLQTGLLRGTPVIQIKGDFNADKLPAFAATSNPVRIACVYLDAKTLWPVQFQWWSVTKVQTLLLTLQIEFSDAELNRELSLDECSRMFSYHPEGNVGVVEVE